MIVVLAAVCSAYVFAAHKARRLMTSGHSVKRFNRISATALGSAAAQIAAR